MTLSRCCRATVRRASGYYVCDTCHKTCEVYQYPTSLGLSFTPEQARELVYMLNHAMSNTSYPDDDGALFDMHRTLLERAEQLLADFNETIHGT